MKDHLKTIGIMVLIPSASVLVMLAVTYVPYLVGCMFTSGRAGVVWFHGFFALIVSGFVIGTYLAVLEEVRSLKNIFCMGERK